MYHKEEDNKINEQNIDGEEAVNYYYYYYYATIFIDVRKLSSSPTTSAC